MVAEHRGCADTKYIQTGGRVMGTGFELRTVDLRMKGAVRLQIITLVNNDVHQLTFICSSINFFLRTLSRLERYKFSLAEPVLV